ncbi:MAG: glycosyltransferase family 1 protein [Candidatus Magasanikiibacteriota bacterium]
MIIGIDASRANEEKKTGVGWYAYHVIQEMKKITPENIRVVLYTNKPLQGELSKLPNGWTEKVLHWSPFGFAHGKPWRLWTQVRLSWEMLISPPDVLFIPAHVFPIIHPKKTVMTVHDIAAIKFSNSYNWFEKWYSVWSAKLALKKLWKVIVPSEFTKKELESLKVESRKGKVQVVYHGYNEDYKKLAENDTEILQKLKKYEIKKPYLLNIGRLETKKNTQRIIEAFDKLKKNYQLPTFDASSGRAFTNYQLVLIGSNGYGYEKIKEAVDTSSYKNDIITPGWVENEDLPYLMNGAEVFVFPSLYEGFGIPVLEAMASGVPVVASGLNGSTSFGHAQDKSYNTASQEVGGDACLYVDPDNIDEIENGILKLIQDREYRMKNIERGLERVKEFSWEKCAKETLDILLNN